ncbi:MAG: hypothetical protein ACLVC2_09035, partial [Emergencia timonensis]
PLSVMSVISLPSVRQLDYYITLDPLCQALFSAASCMCLPPLSDSLIILPSFPYSVKCFLISFFTAFRCGYLH